MATEPDDPPRDGDDDSWAPSVPSIRSDKPDPEESDEIEPDDLDWRKLMDAGHHPDVVELPPPRIEQSSWGLIGQFWAYRNHQKKEKKLAKEGYVKWHLIDGTWSWPKYVKPTADGGGVPEYQHNGQRYLFPKKASLPDASSGAHLFVHTTDDAKPVNLRDRTEMAIPPDVLEEYIQMKVASDPPSFWDKFDFKPESIVYVAIGLIIILAAVSRFAGAMG